MEDDDDFGDLYADVLLPFSTPTFPSQTLISHPKQSTRPEQTINVGAPPAPNQSNGKFSIEKEQEKEVARVSPKMVTEDVPRVLESSRVHVKSEPYVNSVTSNVKIEEETEEIDTRDVVFMERGDNFSGQVKLEEVELDEEPIIPGLSSSPKPLIPTRVFENGEEDYNNNVNNKEYDDSDSEDEFQIVLNEPIGLDRNENEGEDDADNLVIVANGDHPQYNQIGEEKDFDEDSAKLTMDGERMEIGEEVKATDGVMMDNTVGPPGPIFNNQGFQQHHSQCQYVRPGAATVPVGPIIGPGGVQSQVRPPFAGFGRGDWRPSGMAPTMQKGFQTGSGFPGWANNSSGIGLVRGLEFSLPSYKTIFDIDIDSFEEKRWRHPGVDISVYFNFGLSEESWKDYCRQLGQLRLGATMQSKIRVYESGRSEQDYDPDLPPELAAAAGRQDYTVENTHLGKTAGGQGDLTFPGRVTSQVRPPIPTGRAIPVEGGYGERLPSTETRLPRTRERDTDAVIEIVLQDSVDDDSITADISLEQLHDELQGEEDLKGENYVEEGNVQPDTECFDRFPYNGVKKEMEGGRDPITGIHEGDGSLPFHSEAALHYQHGSKGRNPGGTLRKSHDGRCREGTAREKYSVLNTENGNDVIPIQSARVNKIHDNDEDKSGGSSDGKGTLESSSPLQVEAAGVLNVEHKDDMHNQLACADSGGLEKEEMGMDTINRTRSNVPKVQNIGMGDDLRCTPDSDISKIKSESSGEYQKRIYGGEKVVQEDRAGRIGAKRKHWDVDEYNFRRRGYYDRDGRQQMDRNCFAVKGREDSNHTYRDWDPNSAHFRNKTGAFEIPRENSTAGARQRRDDDTHVRRVKHEDKRGHVEEIRSRHGSNARECETNEVDEFFHSRKRMDNDEWWSHHDKVLIQRQRDRDDNLISRRDNLIDHHIQRRKDEEHRMRELAEQKEFLHRFETREGTSRRKQARDDSQDPRMENQLRLKDKLDDKNSIRHRDENWRERDMDDQQRLKRSYEDTMPIREREERKEAAKYARGTEDKHMRGYKRAKDESRGLGLEKDYLFKDKRRQSEQPKRRDWEEDDTLSQHRRREDVYGREGHKSSEDRKLTHERSGANNSRSLNDSQLPHKERQKDNTRRSKESERNDQNVTPHTKRKREPSPSCNLKVSTKVPNEREEYGDLFLTSGAKDSPVPSSKEDHKVSHQHSHSSTNHRGDTALLGEYEVQKGSRKGGQSQSQLENSWMRNKERNQDPSIRSSPPLSTKTNKENSSRNNDELCSLGEPMKKRKKVEAFVDDQKHHLITLAGDRNGRDLENINAADKFFAEDRSHLDTVEKLKKRSERFKLPMSTEIDATSISTMGNKKMDNESFMDQSETLMTVADAAEIKQERPPRKRRWVTSS